ncbi:MAG: hypothetical protein AAF705_22645 [Bacteroidota bacterium]
MRIVGEIKHPSWKITLFQMDTRFSVKFEQGQLEQIYKFRTGDFIQTVQDVRRLITPAFIEKVADVFVQMTDLSTETLAAQRARELKEFDEII